MLYHWYELNHAAVKPARMMAGSARLMLKNPFNPMSHTAVGRQTAAACEVFERTTRRYARPVFGFEETEVDGVSVPVTEEIVWRHPFCNLVRFRREIDETRASHEPRILLVAPMSGHFATLLRGTVEALLPDHDVYVTDWQDARNVPVSAGRFDLDDYIDAIIAMLHQLDGDAHVMAICQPSVPVLAAIARMEAEGDPCVPHSMVLAGGPIDTRVSPTAVNRLAETRGTDWFERTVVTTLPWPNAGFGRRVYPGFLQLTGFMTMNLDRHVSAHQDLFRHLVRGDGDSAAKHREFYDEYLAVMDLTAEFYMQTIDTVFVRHLLPRGEMMHRGVAVEPKAIRRVALMTIEGEKDDITGLGQCAAAHDLCTSIPAEAKLHYECPGVGHYGIFNGSRYRSLIAPRIAQFVRAHDPRSAGIGVSLGRDVVQYCRPAAHVADCEIDAFSIRAANDTAPDAASQRLRAQGLATPARPNEREPSSHASAWQWWTMAQSLMLDGWLRLHAGDPTTTMRSPHSRPTG